MSSLNTVNPGYFEELKNLDVFELRKIIRTGEYSGKTAGLALGYLQGNLVVLSNHYAADFYEYCAKNSKSCPLIAVSKVGSSKLPTLGEDIDVRTDLPEYNIYERGEFIGQRDDIVDLWNDSLVAFVLGCSFSFEDALIKEGMPIRHVDAGVNVSMYKTNLKTKSSELFNGNLVVTMRPFKKEHIVDVVRVTEKFTLAHGAPIHIGDPEFIGINDLNSPDFGDSVPFGKEDVPVFWACGVTTQLAVENARPQLAITHVPGKMLITDKRYSDL